MTAPAGVGFDERILPSRHGGLAIYHVVLLALILVVSFLCWHLIRSAPPVLSRVLPGNLAFRLGAVWFVMALFTAFAGAYELGDGAQMVSGFIQGYVGLWFMFAKSASMRGTIDHDRLTLTVATMVALLFGVVFTSLYVHDPQAMACVNLLLISAGFFVTMRFFRSRDRHPF
jgi:hypothetical protein